MRPFVRSRSQTCEHKKRRNGHPGSNRERDAKKKKKRKCQLKGPSQPHFSSPARGNSFGKGMILTLSVAHLLERRLIPEAVFARLYDKGKTRGDRLDRLCRFLLLGGGHRVGFRLQGKGGCRKVRRRSLEFRRLFVPANHSHGPLFGPGAPPAISNAKRRTMLASVSAVQSWSRYRRIAFIPSAADEL